MKHPRGKGDTAPQGRPRRLRAVAVVTGVGAAVLTPLLVFPALAGASPVQADSVAHLARPAARLGVGPRMPSRIMATMSRPHGRRMRPGRTKAATASSNWSGLAGVGTGVQGAEGQWTVPAITTSTTPKYSASWVGVDGATNSDLIQTGTSQDTSDGYYGWIEILPAYSVPIVDASGDLAPVDAGDDITASVAEVSAGVWTIYLDDETQNWYFEQNFDYSGPGASAEWIEEAPTVDGSQTVPPNFGTVQFSETGVYGDYGSGPGWYSTDLTAANEVAMVNQSGTRVLAMPSAPSAPSSDGQAFADTYVTAPGRPTSLRAGARRLAVALSWSAPATTGGTPVVGYYVREYRSGRLVRRMSVATTSMKITGLVAGKSYSFATAAHSGGNYTSAYSARTPAVRPRK